MELSKEWLETLLVKNCWDSKVHKLLSFETELVSKKGDNYLSVPLRIKMKVILSSGKTVNRSVVLKRKPKTEREVNFLNRYSIYEREIEIFRDILPEMDSLMNEHWDPEDRLWARMLEYKQNQEIIFEDLKTGGYKPANRLKGLDFKHAQLAMASLGRFHALSVMLIDQGRINADLSYRCLICREDHFTRHFIEHRVKCTITTIRNDWGAEWSKYADGLERMYNTGLPKKFSELGKINEKTFLVLNHGDPWTSNLLFKYSPVTGDPTHLKFVDFQVAHYNSPAFDLVYFIYCSVDCEVIGKKMTELLVAYRESILRTFDYYRFTPRTPVPSIDALKEECDRLSWVALIVPISMVPVMRCPSEDVVTFEGITPEEGKIDEEMDPYKGHEESCKVVKQLLTLFSHILL